MGSPLTPARLSEILLLAVQVHSDIEETDPSTAAPPPNPEDPTPGEIQNVSDMLDAANGTLGIIGAIATDPATTAQEKVALILQTLGVT